MNAAKSLIKNVSEDDKVHVSFFIAVHSLLALALLAFWGASFQV